MPPRTNNNNNNDDAVAAANNSNNNMITGIAPSTIQVGYFQGSPITKLFVMVWVLCQFVFKQQQQQSSKSTTNANTNSSRGQMFIATMFLIPNLRKLERELGSIKFCLWLGCTLILTLITLDICKIIIGDYYWYGMFNFVPSNSNNIIHSSIVTLRLSYHPILIGGVLYWYYQFVPRLYPRFVSFLGIQLSEKSLYGIWGMYVLLAGGIWSIITSLFGAISSSIFLSTDLGKNWIELPDWFVSNTIFESLGGLFLLDPPTKIYAPLMMMMNTRGGGGIRNRGNNNNAAAAAAAMAAAMAGGGGGGGGRAAAPVPRRARGGAAGVPPSSSSPPPQAAIDQLTAMGFDEQQVRNALQQSGNNVERAADRLLSG